MNQMFRHVSQYRVKLGFFLLILALILHLAFPMFAFAADFEGMTEEAANQSAFSQFLEIGGGSVHIVMYGDTVQHGNRHIFDPDSPKKVIALLPGLGVASPEIYFKPLAEALQNYFNVLIIEPFGYGRSDGARRPRTIRNINRELDRIMQSLKIDAFIYAAHSMSGVYAMNYVKNYDRAVQIIALDISVSDDIVMPFMEMEMDWMLEIAKEFDALRNTFPSHEAFFEFIYADPYQFEFLWFPEVVDYTFTEADRVRFTDSFARAYNMSIRDELRRGMANLSTVHGKRFPSSLPVISFVAGNTVDFLSQWETAHVDQLDLDSGNHRMYVLEDANHQIWYTHLDEIVAKIAASHGLR